MMVYNGISRHIGDIRKKGENRYWKSKWKEKEI